LKKVRRAERKFVGFLLLAGCKVPLATVPRNALKAIDTFKLGQRPAATQRMKSITKERFLEAKPQFFGLNWATVASSKLLVRARQHIEELLSRHQRHPPTVSKNHSLSKHENARRCSG